MLASVVDDAEFPWHVARRLSRTGGVTALAGLTAEPDGLVRAAAGARRRIQRISG